MTKKASKEALEELHATLAKVLAEGLSKKYTDENGNEAPPPASLLNTARQFLKDNDIQGYPAEGTALQELTERMRKLPFKTDSDEKSSLN